jgi:pyrroline-5-carboxylate reductase
MTQAVGLIGCGNMGRALAAGMLAAGKVSAQQLIASEVDNARAAALREDLGIEVHSDSAVVVSKASVLVLAVKPQQVASVLAGIASQLTAEHLLISMAAGVPTSTLERLGGAARVVRAMPNLPALTGAGATALTAGSRATAQDIEQARALFDAVGKTVVVAEGQMDAVTGLSGSGPAYTMLVIEGLADGGVQAGLPRDVALLLAAQTVYGASKLLLESGEHPATLKDRVASPGGTTIAGIGALEQAGLRHAMMDAVRAATARSKELGAATTSESPARR